MVKLSLVSLGAQATVLGDFPPGVLGARVKATPHWLERGEAAETQRAVKTALAHASDGAAPPRDCVREAAATGLQSHRPWSCHN